MEFFGVGNALYHYRTVNELQQIELCEGLCSLTTLSRIEKGGREVDSLISELLLNRLGKTSDKYDFVLNEEDYILYEMRFSIEEQIQQKNAIKTEELLSKYESLIPPDMIWHQQFLLFHKMYLWMLKEEPKDSIIKGLYEALHMTRADYKDKIKKNILFSTIEIKIIYELFLYGELVEDDLSRVFEFMENYYDEEEQRRLMVPFLYHLVFMYEKEEKYTDVVRVSERAIRLINSGRSFLNLADFYYQKIKAQEKLYRVNGEMEEKREQLIEECNHIYYVYMSEANQEKMKEVVQFYKERLECQLTKQEISSN